MMIRNLQIILTVYFLIKLAIDLITNVSIYEMLRKNVELNIVDYRTIVFVHVSSDLLLIMCLWKRCLLKTIIWLFTLIAIVTFVLAIRTRKLLFFFKLVLNILPITFVWLIDFTLAKNREKQTLHCANAYTIGIDYLRSFLMSILFIYVYICLLMLAYCKQQQNNSQQIVALIYQIAQSIFVIGCLCLKRFLIESSIGLSVTFGLSFLITISLELKYIVLLTLIQAGSISILLMLHALIRKEKSCIDEKMMAEMEEDFLKI